MQSSKLNYPATSSRRNWLKISSTALAAGFLWPNSRLFAQSASSPSSTTVAANRVTLLSLNENPFGPSRRALDEVKANLATLYRYTGEEAPTLTQQIATLEKVAPEQILLGELLEPLGLHLGLQGGPGSEFIYSVPGFTTMVDAAARVGGVVVSVPLNSNLENDLPSLAAKINGRTKAVYIVNPHNPSGTASSASEFSDFLRKASKQALVVVDEAYLEFADDFSTLTATALTRAGENVIVFRTFSKIHGLAALSFGYAVAPRPVADFLRSRGMGSAHDLNRLSIAAASGSLKDPSHVTSIRRVVANERTKWHKELDSLGLRHTASVSNFVFFDARRPYAEIAGNFARKNIIVGRAFPPLDTWVRISIGLQSENARARKALREMLAGPK